MRLRSRLFGSLSAVLLLGLASGCVSEEELRLQLDEHVQESNECAQDADCALIYPSCPLGCFAAVRADQVEACQARADELVGIYESGGRACEYDCPAPGPAFCDEDGRCAVELAP